MIDRLVTTVRALADLPSATEASDEIARLAADCADALRLELDCPQQELTIAQRDSLVTLGDALDSPLDIHRVRAAAAAARRALGIDAGARR